MKGELVVYMVNNDEVLPLALYNDTQKGHDSKKSTMEKEDY